MIAGEANSIATIVLWNYAAIIVNIIGFVIMYMKANKNASLKAFFVVQFAMIIWLMGKVFKTVSPNVDLRWFFIVFYYFGICLLGASFLDFAYIYYKGNPMNKVIRRIIYIIAIAEFAMVVTNPYHHLFYKVYDFRNDDFGILFYLHLAVNYFFTITGMLLCGNKFSKQLQDKSRFERNIISIAILIPLALNFLYITRILESLFIQLGIGDLIFDITPIVYTWSSLVFIYATFKYDFFDLTPMMKHEITARLDHPILVLNTHAEVLYSNDQFKHNLDYLQIKEKLIANLEGESCSNETIIEYKERFYKYYINTFRGIAGKQYILAFTDISAYHYTRIELDKENSQLELANRKLENQIEMLKQTSHIGARSYIARELHDILGHSLVITIKLLEVSKMFYKQNRTRALESLEKASKAINEGFDEMKNIKSRKKGALYNTFNLERELRSMLKMVEVSGVSVTFFVRGQNDKIEEAVYDIVKKVITELVTNTLKHANASKFLLLININNEQISLQTMDNGNGVNVLKKGNGLKGIDDRLALVKGSVKYTYSSVEGFSSNIMIPV